MVVELLISACLLAEPEKCKEVSLISNEDGITEVQCFTLAPSVIASWNDNNPKYYVKRWECHRKIEEKI